jgi:phage gp46-like protein
MSHLQRKRGEDLEMRAVHEYIEIPNPVATCRDRCRPSHLGRGLFLIYRKKNITVVEERFETYWDDRTFFLSRDIAPYISPPSIQTRSQRLEYPSIVSMPAGTRQHMPDTA